MSPPRPENTTEKDPYGRDAIAEPGSTTRSSPTGGRRTSGLVEESLRTSTQSCMTRNVAARRDR
jgi:hypothetical protein